MGTCLNSLTVFDKNADGAFTLSDAISSFKAFVNLPMEIVLDSIDGSDVYRFFEINAQSCTSYTTIVMSCFLWFVVISWFSKLAQYTDQQARDDYEQKKRDMGY